MGHLVDRKFVVIAVYLVGAVVAGLAYLVNQLEGNSTLAGAIPGAVERAAFWPVFIFTGFFG